MDLPSMFLDLLIVVLTTAHLLLAGAASVGPLLVVLAEWRGGARDDLAMVHTARRVALLVVEIMFVSFLLGGLLAGLRLWADGPAHFQPLVRLGVSRLWWGLAEAAFSLGCMFVYWRFWDALARRKWLHRLFALFAATNLMYHFPMLFAAAATLSEREPAETSPVRFLVMLGDPAVLARAAHHLLAGAAGAGVLWALVCLRKDRAGAARVNGYPESGTGALDHGVERYGNHSGREPAPLSGQQLSAAGAKDMEPSPGEAVARAAARESSASGPAEEKRLGEASRLASLGGKWTLVAMIAQFAVGVWLVTQVGAVARERLLGGDAWSFTAALVGICAGLLVQHHAAAVAFGGGTRQQIRRMALLLVVTYFAMAVATKCSRVEETPRETTSPQADAERT